MISFLDVVFGAIALFLLVRGLFRGLLREVLSTAGVVGAWWLAGRYGQAVGKYAEAYVDGPGLAGFVGYLAVFFAVMLGVKFVTWLVAKVLQASPAAWIDIPGGGLVGLAKGWLLCCVILAGLLSFMPDADFIKRSQSVPLLMPGAQFLKDRSDFQGSLPDLAPDELFPSAPEPEPESDGEDGAGLTEKARGLLDKIGESMNNLTKEENAQ